MNQNNLNNLDTEIDFRLSNSNWDEKIANKVIQKIEKKQRIRNSILSFAFILIVSSGALFYSNQEEQAENTKNVISLLDLNDSDLEDISILMDE